VRELSWSKYTIVVGSENRLRLYRMGRDGQIQMLGPQLSDAVMPNDVLYIKESIF